MEKSNGKLYCIIVILCLLVVGLGGFIVYKEFMVSDDTSKTSVVVNKETQTNTAAEILQIDGGKLIDGLVNNNLTYLTDCNFIETFVNDKKVEAKDISNLAAYHIAESEFEKDETVSLNKFNSVIAKHLGDNYSFDPTTINYKGESCPSFSYDSSTKNFTKQETACGGICNIRTSYQVENTYLIGDIVTVNVKVIFADITDSVYYSDYARTNKIGVATSRITNYQYSQGANYKFKFQLEDGNYVFKSSEPIK